MLGKLLRKEKLLVEPNSLWRYLVARAVCL
jgi:hypothetical protein